MHELVKIKEVDLQNQTAPQLSVDTVSKSTSNNNVPQKDTVVNNYDMQDNVKNSRKDSEGNILSEEQQKFFADSKVRDEDGRLIPVYHGTFDDFTIFDIDKTSNINIYGKGPCFTNSKHDATKNYASIDGDNGVMVQDKDDANKYKLVVYEPMEENIDVEAVYLLENYDYNIHDDNENILQNIVIWEKEGRNEISTKRLLQDYSLLYGTIFGKYNRETRRFVKYARESKLLSKGSKQQSNRTGISERAGEAGKYSLKEKPIDVDRLLEENEELSVINEQLQEMLAIARKETTITGRHNLSRNSVDNVATYFRRNYGSTYSKRSLSARLDGFCGL